MIAQVATCLLFDKKDKLLIYLRDDKPTIPFPNHWDLFGGWIEDGETPEQALTREVKEELGIDITDIKKIGEVECLVNDAKPNIKHVFSAKTDKAGKELSLLECGQRIAAIDLNERHNYKFANILAQIVDDFASSLSSLRRQGS